MTLVYRKKKFAGLYTKWDSFTTRKYNVNLLRTLTFRFVQNLLFTYVASIYSQRFAKTSPSNGNPQRIINYNMNDILKKNQNKFNSPVFTVRKKDLIVLLSLLGLERSQISKRLKS